MIFLCFSIGIQAQDIIWADHVLKSTSQYENNDNHAGMAIGVPFMYQDAINEVINPNTEGYIIHNINLRKKNTIHFGFPRVVGAEQLVLGGIFNLGSIYSVKIIDFNKTETEVYRMTKGSVSKFHTFNIYFEPTSVISVKIEFDHSKVNEWNLLRGIGLSESNEPIKPFPNIYDSDEFYGKEKIEFTHSNKDCLVFSPKLSHDANTLYLVEECNQGADQDIWMSKRDSSTQTWSKSVKMDFPINNNGHNFVASVGEEDRFLLLGNAYNADGSNAGDGVSITRAKKDGTWEFPTNISIPGINNKSEHANFYMTGDEKTMLLSINNPDSRGDLDLYVSHFVDSTKTWTKPLNLGWSINTLFAEDSPCLSEDGRFLYFSSKGFVGFGGYDLYVSERLDNSWQYWSTPKNLGFLVNTKTDDFGFSISRNGKIAYYNSINFENDSTISTDILQVNLPKALVREPKVELKGKVISEKNGEGLDALISISNENGTIQSFYNSNNQKGEYMLSFPVQEKYILNIENEFHYKKTIEITNHELKNTNRNEINFALSPFPDSGATYQIQKISFIKGKSELNSLSGSALDSLVIELTKYPDGLVQIAVHTDANGDAKKNMELTTERAKSIKNYLVSRGIGAERILHKGYGSEKPLIKSTTELDRIKNRRIELSYLGKISKQKTELILK